LRRLSATGGNPFGNPGGLIEANKQIGASLDAPWLQNYRNQNASTGGYGAFNTAAPGAAMTAASLRYVRANPERLEALRTNAARLKQALRGCGFAVEDNGSPVAAFVHGDAAQMQAIQQALWAQGIFVIYSTYVGAGPEGALRIAAFADHQAEDYERLAEALAPFA
jgi:7-keto-8-aminopelargonate synthetase-like enzyme